MDFLVEISTHWRRKAITAILAILLCGSQAIALAEINGVEEKVEPISGSQKPSQGFLVKTHRKASLLVTSPAVFVDSFFNNKKDNFVKNGTNLTLSQSFLFRDRKDPVPETNYIFNLRLPNIQKRLQLTVEKRSEENNENNVVPNSVLNSEQDRDEENIRVGLNYVQKPDRTPIVKSFLKSIGYKFSVGAKLKAPPIPYVNLTIDQERKYGQWKNSNIVRLFFDREDLFGQTLVIDFDRPLTKSFLLRLGFEESYLQRNQNIRTSTGPTLFHILSQKQSLAYSYKLRSSTKPQLNFDEHFLGVLYRFNFYENYLYWDISPSVFWKRSQSFTAQAQILTKLSLVFGE